MPVLLALASAATFGVADFLGGVSTRKANVLAVTLLTNLTGAGIAVVILFFVGGQWSTSTIVWSAGAGLCGLAGLLLLYTGLAIGPNKLVSPLSAVIAASVPVIAGLLLGDRPNPLAMAGLLIVSPAVWLLAGGELSLKGVQRRPILFSVGAGLGFGLFFTLLAQVPDESGAVPLLAARTVSITVVVIAAIVTRPKLPSPKWGGVSVVAGALDMTANGLFLWSSRDGDLAIVGALVSLFPATTIILAVIVLGERLTRSQILGLGLALCAAALMS